MSISQNGWPVLERDSRFLYTWSIPTKDGVVKIRLRNGSAGFLLCHFLLWYADVIEPVFSLKLLDDWGHNIRPIRGQTTGYSNHASGTAMDVNATRHPLGAVGTLAFKVGVLSKRAWALTKIRARLLMYRGCIRAGAFYSGRRDEMHYEIDKPLADCERVARRLMSSPRGKIILDANPDQRAVILS